MPSHLEIRSANSPARFSVTRPTRIRHHRDVSVGVISPQSTLIPYYARWPWLPPGSNLPAAWLVRHQLPLLRGIPNSTRRGRHYCYFSRIGAVATAGYSIYIYHLTSDDVRRVMESVRHNRIHCIDSDIVMRRRINRVERFE